MKNRLCTLAIISVLIFTACAKDEAKKGQDENSGGTENITVIEEKTEKEKDKEAEEEKTSEEPKPSELPSPEETEEEVNILLKMGAEEKREVNIFLSNFSEAFYDPSSGYFGVSEAKIDFAFRHASINDSAKIIFAEECMGISAENVDSILRRFFGKTVSHTTPENSRIWTYEDGNFLTIAASGESYGNFSIATEVKERKEGNYEVLFNIYNDPEITGGDIITDKSVYSLNDSQAAAKYTLIERGIAVLKPKTYNGANTYELVSYVVEEL